MKVKMLLNLLALLLAKVSSSPWNEASCFEDEESSNIINDDKMMGEQIVDAPSSAPSEELVCTSHTSNARGRYTSTVTPCTFHFHKADPVQSEMDLIKFHTSNLCSSDNAFLSVVEYVEDWADECVGDFQRCYSLEHHRSIVWDFLCSKDWQQDIPDGTTHISVDCTRDKALVSESYIHQKEEEIQEEKDARLEFYENELFNLILILGVCLIGLYAISNLIVKPLLSSSLPYNKVCRMQHVLPRTSSCNCDTCREVQHHQGDHQDENEYDEDNDNNNNNSNDDDDYVHESEMGNFELQVPADFDAVPIVPAQILY